MSTQPTVTPGREEPVDAREYLRPIWRRKWLIAAIVVIAAGGAYGIAKLQHTPATPIQVTHSYSTSSQIYIETIDPTSLVGAANSNTNAPQVQSMQDLALLFTLQSTVSAVYKQLHMPVGSAGSVSASIWGGPTSGSNILVVTATSRSPQLAARLNNTYVNVWLGLRSARYQAAAQAQATQIRQELRSVANTPANATTRSQLQIQALGLEQEARNPQAGAYQIAPAAPGSAVSSGGSAGATPPSPTRNAAIGAGVGLLIGLALAFGLNFFDRRMLRVNAIQAGYGREVLSVLPHVADAAPVADEQPILPLPLVEALRALRISLRLSGGKRAPRTILVTSAMPGEGKSTLARNLALVCADGGERVLLIDADLRRPSVPRLFGIEPVRGLTHVLAGSLSPGNAVVHVIKPTVPPSPNGAATNGHGTVTSSFDAPIAGAGTGSLDVLAHGDLHSNPVTLFGSHAMETLLTSAREQYDVVIIDSAPILAVSDTVPLLSQVDGVLIVARLGVTTRDAAARLNETVSRVPDTTILGVVANDMRDTFLDTSYGGMYSSRYGGYGYRGADEQQPVRTA
jgi:Mrp family chromosome partitioning ATPase/capsular polysaccharide biosynthesis protein